MEPKALIELIANVIDEVNKVATYPASQYARDFEVEVERVDKAKLEKIGNLIAGAKFFIDHSGLAPEKHDDEPIAQLSE